MIPIYSPSFNKEEKELLSECIDTGWISSQGKFIEQFENNFSNWNMMQHGVATSSCTSALHLALVALGVGENDEVICPDLTFIAPANMIRWAGAKPILVDVHPVNWGIDPIKLEDKITAKTKAIIVVHAFGHSADMDPISAIAKKHNLYIIEDVAEAPGAKYKDKMVGTMGNASCYSFFANKIMTTGEGGAVLTNNSMFDEKVRCMRTHGMTKKQNELNNNDGPWYYEMHEVGYNYRITDFQCVLGSNQLRKLDQFVQKRRKIARIYDESFSNIDNMGIPEIHNSVDHAYHLYPLQIEFEKLFINKIQYFDKMKQVGINLNVHYIPVHTQPYYMNKFGFRSGDFPLAERFYKNSVSIPLYPSLIEDEIERVVTNIIRNIGLK